MSSIPRGLNSKEAGYIPGDMESMSRPGRRVILSNVARSSKNSSPKSTYIPIWAKTPTTTSTCRKWRGFFHRLSPGVISETVVREASEIVAMGYSLSGTDARAMDVLNP